MENETKKEKIIIKLTDRRVPISIDPDEWPVIAVANSYWFNGEYECQADRTMRCFIKVRQRGPGKHAYTSFRAVVCAKYTYSSSWANEHNITVAVGRMCEEEDDLPETIEQVASDLASALRDVGHEPPVEGVCRGLCRNAVADLPAEEL